MKVKKHFLSRMHDQHFRVRFVNEFQRVSAWVENKIDLENANIYDFGCGSGITALSFALHYPDATVHGSDIYEGFVDTLKMQVRDELAVYELPSNLHLYEIAPSEMPVFENKLDVIYSWSVFEHVRRDYILDILEMLKKNLRKGGLFYLQINPLYFSPRGAHLYSHVPDAWSHLVFQNDVLKEYVFSSNSDMERKKRDWEKYETLNKITADELLNYCSLAGFELLREVRVESELEPPKNLLDIYKREVLITDEIVLLFSY